MRRFAQSLGFVAAAALVGGVGCCNNSTGSNASNGTASNGGASNGGATNGANAGATNGANAGATNGASAGATNGANGTGGTAGNGTTGNGGASNGASNGGSNGGASCTDSSTCTSGYCIAGACTNPDCNVPELVATNLELTTACPIWYIGIGGTDVEGSASPVLTVDPGVTVSVAPAGYLVVGIDSLGTLQVNGTDSKPVVINGLSQMPGSWAGILFGDNSSGSALTSTTISYGGGVQPGLVSDVAYAGAIMVLGDQTSPVLVSLQSVTVENNGGSGFVFAGPEAGLAAGSGNLTASDWAAGSYPFVVDANQVSTLPATLSAGTASGPPVVALACQGNQDCGNPLTVDHDETWPALPMPYSILEGAGVNVEGAGTSVATLTIEAPNKFEFVDGSAFQVDSLILGQGELVAVGTAQNHIVFESVDTNPTFSAWQGIQLVSSSVNALQGTSMAYCDIEDAMGFTVAVGGVPGNVSGEITVNGSFFTSMPDAGPIGPSIANCTFSNYGSCGVFTQAISNPSIYGTQNAGADGNVFTPATGTASDGQVVGDVCSI
jgi:hypothetical protein